MIYEDLIAYLPAIVLVLNKPVYLKDRKQLICCQLVQIALVFLLFLFIYQVYEWLDFE